MTTIYQPTSFDFKGAYQILQGSTFEIPITLTLASGPLNLSAYAANPPRCQFRTPNFAAPGTPLITPVCTWIDATIAKFNFRIEAATTTLLVMGTALTIDGVYDIEVFTSGGTPDVLRVLEGTWTLKAEVTR